MTARRTVLTGRGNFIIAWVAAAVIVSSLLAVWAGARSESAAADQLSDTPRPMVSASTEPYLTESGRPSPPATGGGAESSPQPEEPPAEDGAASGTVRGSPAPVGEEPADEAPDAPSDEPSVDDRAESEHEPGSLDPVTVEPVVVAEPIELEETADFGTGLTVRLVDIEPVSGEAQRSGEVAGPALRVVVEATNTTGEPISLARVQVDVSHGRDRVPGMALDGPDTEPFPDSLAPNETAAAAVVFGVPRDRRDLVQILVSHTTEAPTVVFEGAAP